MPIDIITEGDKNKQGNARCPQCGVIVLITNHYGDPLKCGKCSVPYVPTLRPVKYT